MIAPKVLALSITAGFAPAVVAQLSGWETNEVNTTMCTWAGLQAAVVRDTLYMDGGDLWWRPGLADGSYGDVMQDNNPNGVVYTLNFSIPFNLTESQNFSALFGQLPPKGSSSTLYSDGAMLANDYNYFLFAGLLTDTDYTAEPADDQGLECHLYRDTGQSSFQYGEFSTYDLSGNMTRYIAYGGAANAPSENLAFYFSGMHSPTWGEVYNPDGNSSHSASETSNTLITLDMTTAGSPTWTNSTLQDGIPGRASPELVWVPVGKQGILVALGGVVYPDFVNVENTSSNETASEEQSPAFMTNINIYDISNKTWYSQTTTGGPGALTQGCAVMQPAQDYSSFNIYWYGGYDGVHYFDDSYWNDAVWILSLPSFTWKQASTNRTGFARAGHKCVMPYPDQMMVVGGLPVQSGGYTCVTDMIMVFNVSSAEWLDRYDPAVWSDYSVPSVIYEAIGGDGSGGATSTAPATWDTSSLGDVFQVAYATSKITTWYPYHEASSTSSSSNPTYTASSKSHNSGVPKFLAPLLGVLLGLIFVSSLAVGFILWRRRRLLKKNGGVSLAPTDENRRTIMSWINGQRGVEAKADTVTTSDELTNPTSPTPDGHGFNQTQQYPFTQSYLDQPQIAQIAHTTPQPIHHEMSGTEIVELPAEPRAAELSDEPLTPADIVERSFSGTNHSRGTPAHAYNSSFQNTDQGSLVSSTSYPRNTTSPPAPPSSTSHATSSAAGPQQVAPQTNRSPVVPESAVLPQALSAAYDNDKTLPELPASSEHTGGHAAAAPAQATQEAAAGAAAGAAGAGVGGVRGGSQVSGFSERERAHLRSLSDPATVSTMDATIGGEEAAEPGQTTATTTGGRVASPPILEEGAVDAANAPSAAHHHGDDDDGRPSNTVSPPTGDTVEADDYISAVTSPVGARGGGEAPGPGSARRSAFRESQEDLGGEE